MAASDFLFSTIFEQAGIGMLVTDQSGRVLESNRKLQEWLGYSAIELQGMTVEQITFPDDISTDHSVLDELTHAKRTHYRIEKRYVRKNGDAVWGRTTVSLVHPPKNTPFLMLRLIEDINAKRPTIETYTDTDAALEIALRRSGTVVFTQDRDLRYTMVFNPNPGFNVEVVLGKTDEDLLPAEDAARLTEIKQKVLDTGIAAQADVRTTIDGETYYYELFSEPITNEDKEVIGVMSSSFDITKRTKALQELAEHHNLLDHLVKERTEALHQREAMLQALLNAPMETIAFLDHQGTILNINESGARRFGTTPDELVGRNVYDIMSPSVTQAQKPLIERVLKTGAPAHFEDSHASRYYANSVYPVIDKNSQEVIGVAIYASDITERKQSEEKLRESEERFRRAVADAPFPMLIHAEDGEIVVVNQVWTEITGYTHADIPTIDAWTERAYGESKKTVQAGIDRLYGMQERHTDGEYVITTQRGEQRTWDFSSSPVGRLPDGRRLVLSMAMDVTERKYAENLLRQQNQYLLSLQETSFDLVSELDLDQLLENIVQRAADLAGTSAGLLDLLDPETNQLLPKVGLGALTESLKFEVSPGEGLAGIVWQTGQPLIVDDYDNWPGRIDGFDRNRIRSIIGVPLLQGSQVKGVLGLAYDTATQGIFGPETIEILTQFAQLAAVAIENARLFTRIEQELRERERAEESLRQSHRELDIRNRLATIFLTIPDDEMYTEALKVVLDVMESEYGVFGYIDENGDLIVPTMTRTIWNECEVPDKRIVFPRETWGNSSWPRAMREKRTIYSNEPSTHTPQGHVRIERHISMPIIYREESIGLIQVANKATAYVENDIEMLQTLGGIIAPILHARLQAEREEQQRQQAEEALRRYAERLAAINRLDRIISSGLDISQVYDSFVNELQTLVPLDRTAIILLNEAGDQWQVVRQRTQYQPVILPNEWRSTNGSAIAWVIANRAPLIEDEIGEREVWIETPPLQREGIRSRSLLPLIIQERVIGVMTVGSRTPSAFAEEDQHILTTIADQLAIAIHNSRLFEQVQRHAAELEQRIIERTAELSDLYNNAPCGYHSLDGDGLLERINDTELAWLGYDREEIIGKIRFPDLLTPASVSTFDENFPIFKERGWIRDLEFDMVRKNGSVLPVLLSATAIYDQDGKYLTSRSTMIDHTGRKRAEDALRQRTAQLEAANKELEAFSYSISHDLRAPLRAIDGFSRIVLRDYAPLLPATGQRQLQTIRDSAQQMGRLIDDLLAFSRLGRHPIQKRTVSPQSLAQTVFEELRSEYEHRQVNITIGDLPECQADPALLKQVFVNLLTNAIKFTHPREIAHIEVGTLHLAEQSVYFVKDNGVGFDMRYADKLFGVFQRLHPAEEFEGTGVGLAIVQRIIHRHGGRVWAESQIDQGTTFYFTTEGEPAHG